MPYIPRLKKLYLDTVLPKMIDQFKYKNKHQVPTIKKITINMGVGQATADIKQLDNAMKDLAIITGQFPKLSRAKKSEASFKLKQGMPIGCYVTLRKNRMWEFLDRFINVACPRIRDFRGLPLNSFDGMGNYNIGITEQIIFPEIQIDKIDKIRGMDIAISTTAKTDSESKYLLELLGLPFAKK